jgi:hypothetical protein
MPPAQRNHVRIIKETGSGMIAVMARSGPDGRWVQVDSVGTKQEAALAADRLEANRHLRIDTIAEWQQEDWKMDAPINDPNEEDF